MCEGKPGAQLVEQGRVLRVRLRLSAGDVLSNRAKLVGDDLLAR